MVSAFTPRPGLPTPRQADVLEFVADRLTCCGVAPTVKEIGELRFRTGSVGPWSLPFYGKVK